MHVPAVCLPCVHRMLTVCAGKSMVKVDPCMCEAASVHEFKLGANGGGGAATTGTAATTGAAAAAAAAMAALHARGLTNNRQLGASSYVPHRRATVEEARGAVLEAAAPRAPGCSPTRPRLQPTRTPGCGPACTRRAAPCCCTTPCVTSRSSGGRGGRHSAMHRPTTASEVRHSK